MSGPPPIPPKPTELQGEPLPAVPRASAPATPAVPGGTGAKPVNRYTRRLAGTPKPCFVCHRPSPVVLVSVSLPNEDFFYTCTTHLSDRHFATQLESAPAVPAAPTKPKVSQEEIEKIKKEYEAKLKAKETKQDSSTDKDKKDSTEKDKQPSWLGSAVGSFASAVASIAVPSSVAVPAPVPAMAETSTAAAAGMHERYALDRGYFAMRTELWKKREAARRMRSLHMPSAPSRTLGGSSG